MSRILKLVPFVPALLAICLSPGCGSTTNEAGAGPAKGQPPPNAPTSQAEHYKQLQDQGAFAKRGSAQRK